MLQIDLSATVRNRFGKGAIRKLRRNGLTPAILYGPEMENIPLEMDTKGLTRELLNIGGRNALINIDIHDGGTSSRKHVIIKDVQADPIKDELIHADFYEISLDKLVTFPVPLQYEGKAAGVDLGGDLVVNINSVMLRGRILDLPDIITINVSKLGLGDKISLEELSLPSGVDLIDDKEVVCVFVQPPKGAAEATTDNE